IKLVELGSAIVQGMIKGIEDDANELFSSLRHLAESALQSAKDAIHIGSPSRDFANYVGKPIVEGIGVGIATQMPDLLDQVSAIGGQIAQTMQHAIGGLGHGGDWGKSNIGSGISVSQTASPSTLMMRNAGAQTTYNGPVGARTVNLTYHTAVAPS